MLGWSRLSCVLLALPLLLAEVAKKKKGGMPEGAVRINFHNLLNNHVQLYWVDPSNGNEQPVIKIRPHDKTEQISFPEHQFVAREFGKEHVLLGRYHITAPEHLNIPAVFKGEIESHAVCTSEPKVFESRIVADKG